MHANMTTLTSLPKPTSSCAPQHKQPENTRLATSNSLKKLNLAKKPYHQVDASTQANLLPYLSDKAHDTILTPIQSDNSLPITYDSDDEMLKHMQTKGRNRNLNSSSKNKVRSNCGIYSREDIREQYCINEKELQAFEHISRNRLFGCLSAGNLLNLNFTTSNSSSNHLSTSSCSSTSSKNFAFNSSKTPQFNKSATKKNSKQFSNRYADLSESETSSDYGCKQSLSFLSCMRKHDRLNRTIDKKKQYSIDLNSKTSKDDFGFKVQFRPLRNCTIKKTDNLPTSISLMLPQNQSLSQLQQQQQQQPSLDYEILMCSNLAAYQTQNLEMSSNLNLILNQYTNSNKNTQEINDIIENNQNKGKHVSFEMIRKNVTLSNLNQVSTSNTSSLTNNNNFHTSISDSSYQENNILNTTSKTLNLNQHQNEINQLILNTDNSSLSDKEKQTLPTTFYLPIYPNQFEQKLLIQQQQKNLIQSLQTANPNVASFNQVQNQATIKPPQPPVRSNQRRIMMKTQGTQTENLSYLKTTSNNSHSKENDQNYQLFYRNSNKKQLCLNQDYLHENYPHHVLNEDIELDNIYFNASANLYSNRFNQNSRELPAYLTLSPRSSSKHYNKRKITMNSNIPSNVNLIDYYLLSALNTKHPQKLFKKYTKMSSCLNNLDYEDEIDNLGLIEKYKKTENEHEIHKISGKMNKHIQHSNHYSTNQNSFKNFQKQKIHRKSLGDVDTNSIFYDKNYKKNLNVSKSNSTNHLVLDTNKFFTLNDDKFCIMNNLLDETNTSEILCGDQALFIDLSPPEAFQDQIENDENKDQQDEKNIMNKQKKTLQIQKNQLKVETNLNKISKMENNNSVCLDKLYSIYKSESLEAICLEKKNFLDSETRSTSLSNDIRKAYDDLAILNKKHNEFDLNQKYNINFNEEEALIKKLTYNLDEETKEQPILHEINEIDKTDEIISVDKIEEVEEVDDVDKQDEEDKKISVKEKSEINNETQTSKKCKFKNDNIFEMKHTVDLNENNNNENIKKVETKLEYILKEDEQINQFSNSSQNLNENLILKEIKSQIEIKKENSIKEEDSIDKEKSIDDEDEQLINEEDYIKVAGGIYLRRTQSSELSTVSEVSENLSNELNKKSPNLSKTSNKSSNSSNKSFTQNSTESISLEDSKDEIILKSSNSGTSKNKLSSDESCEEVENLLVEATKTAEAIVALTFKSIQEQSASGKLSFNLAGNDHFESNETELHSNQNEICKTNLKNSSWTSLTSQLQGNPTELDKKIFHTFSCSVEEQCLDNLELEIENINDEKVNSLFSFSSLNLEQFINQNLDKNQNLLKIKPESNLDMNLREYKIDEIQLEQKPTNLLLSEESSDSKSLIKNLPYEKMIENEYSKQINYEVTEKNLDSKISHLNQSKNFISSDKEKNISKLKKTFDLEDKNTITNIPTSGHVQNVISDLGESSQATEHDLIGFSLDQQSSKDICDEDSLYLNTRSQIDNQLNNNQIKNYQNLFIEIENNLEKPNDSIKDKMLKFEHSDSVINFNTIKKTKLKQCSLSLQEKKIDLNESLVQKENVENKQIDSNLNFINISSTTNVKKLLEKFERRPSSFAGEQFEKSSIKTNSNNILRQLRFKSQSIDLALDQSLIGGRTSVHRKESFKKLNATLKTSQTIGHLSSLEILPTEKLKLVSDELSEQAKQTLIEDSTIREDLISVSLEEPEKSPSTSLTTYDEHNKKSKEKKIDQQFLNEIDIVAEDSTELMSSDCCSLETKNLQTISNCVPLSCSASNEYNVFDTSCSNCIKLKQADILNTNVTKLDTTEQRLQQTSCSNTNISPQSSTISTIDLLTSTLITTTATTATTETTKSTFSPTSIMTTTTTLTKTTLSSSSISPSESLSVCGSNTTNTSLSTPKLKSSSIKITNKFTSNKTATTLKQIPIITNCKLSKAEAVFHGENKILDYSEYQIKQHELALKQKQQLLQQQQTIKNKLLTHLNTIGVKKKLSVNLDKKQTKNNDTFEQNLKQELIETKKESSSLSADNLLKNSNENLESNSQLNLNSTEFEPKLHSKETDLFLDKEFNLLNKLDTKINYRLIDELDEDIGIHSASYTNDNWFYITHGDELAVWNYKLDYKLLNLDEYDLLNNFKQNAKKISYYVDDGQDALFCSKNKKFIVIAESEKNFRKHYESITHRMMHRKASIEMFKQILKNKFAIEKHITVNRLNGEFGFRIHGSRPVVVSAIEKNTSADFCGLELGDIIVTINDVNVLDFTHSDVVRLAHSGCSTLTLGVISISNVINKLKKNYEKFDETSKTSLSDPSSQLETSSKNSLKSDLTNQSNACEKCTTLNSCVDNETNSLHQSTSCTQKNTICSNENESNFPDNTTNQTSLSKTEVDYSNANMILLTGYLQKTRACCDLNLIEEDKWRYRLFRLRIDGTLHWFQYEHETIDPLGILTLKGCYTKLVSDEVVVPSTSHEKDATKYIVFGLFKNKTNRPLFYFKCKKKETSKKWIYLMNALSSQLNTVNLYIERTLRYTHSNPIYIRNSDCLGYLGKKSMKTNKYKQRYFVLKDACLYFYLEITSNLVLGVFYLHGYKIQSYQDGNHVHCIQIIPSNKDYKQIYLLADSEIDKKRWMAALEYSIDRWIKLN